MKYKIYFILLSSIMMMGSAFAAVPGCNVQSVTMVSTGESTTCGTQDNYWHKVCSYQSQTGTSDKPVCPTGYSIFKPMTANGSYSCVSTDPIDTINYCACSCPSSTTTTTGPTSSAPTTTTTSPTPDSSTSSTSTSKGG